MKVFLSYPYRDHDLAEEVRQAIRACGAEVLSADPVTVGESLSSAIATRVAAADAFVVLMTGGSGPSQWTLLELGAAVASGKPLIPLLAEDGAEIPLIVRDRVYLDIRDPGGRPEALRQLCQVLAARSDVQTEQSFRALEAFAQASATLQLEREAYERSSQKRYDRAEKILVVVAVIAVIASAVVLLVTGGSQSSGLAAIASGITAAIGAALGFYFGSGRRAQQGD